MSFKKNVTARLERLEDKMDQLIEIYGEAERLKEQNEALFDRLMSRNWDEYYLSPSASNRLKRDRPEPTVLLPSQDEASIGGVFTNEELSG